LPSVDTNKVDTTKSLNAIKDSLTNTQLDSLAQEDSAIDDSTKTRNKAEELGIRISEDALPAVVTTKAKDSAVMDMKQSVFYLYGEAQANYEEITIKSGKLIFSQKTNILSAEPFLD